MADETEEPQANPDTPPGAAPLPGIMDRVAKARAAGFSYEDINADLQGRRDAAKAAGFSDAEINEHWGLTTQAPAPTSTPQPKALFNDNIAPTIRSFADNYLTPGDRPFGRTPLNPEQYAALPRQQKVERFFQNLGWAGVDIASILPRSVVNGAAAIMEGLDGKPRTDEEQAALGQEAQGFLGLLAGGLKFGGAKGTPKEVPFPTMQDTVDAATSITAQKSAEGITVSDAGKNILKNYAETGEQPVDAAMRASHDPALRDQLASPHQPETPPASSETVTSDSAVATETPTERIIRENKRMTDLEAERAAAERGDHVAGNPSRSFESIAKDAEPGQPAEGDFVIPRMAEEHGAATEEELNHQGRMHEDVPPHEWTEEDFAAAVKKGITDSTERNFENAARQRAHALAMKSDLQYASQYRLWRSVENITNTADREAEMEKLAKGEGQPEIPPQFVKEAYDAFHKQAEANKPEPAGPVPGAKGEGNNPPPAGGGQPPKPPAPGGGLIGGPESPEGGPRRYADPMQLMKDRIAPNREGNWIKRLRQNARQFYLQMFNPADPFNQLAEAAMNGRRIPDAENPAFINRLAENWRQRAWYMISKNMVDTRGNVVGPGLREIMQSVKGKESDFFGYAVAKWAVEKATQAKETGVELDAAKQVLDMYKEFEAPFQKLMDWQNSTLMYAHDSGLISADAVQKIIEENRSRIPGYRDQGEENVGVGPTGGGKTVRSPLKEFFGSDKQIKPVFQSLVRDAMRRIQAADQNRANLALADLAAEIGEAERVGGARAMKVDPATFFDLNIDPDMQGWEDLGVEPHETESTKPDVSKWAASQGVRADEVPILRQGQLERWKFKDPDLTKYMRGYDQGQRSVLARALAGLTKFTRAAIVNNPAFALHIAGYDTVWQFIKQPGFRNTLADFTTGLGARLGGGEKYDAWLRSGGAEGVFSEMARDPYVVNLLKTGGDKTITNGVWNTIKTPFHFIKVISQAIMDAQKVGRYTRGLEAGESPTRAAVASTESAFHRGGFGGATLKTINSIVPFTGAFLNGLEQTIRGQFGIGKTILGEQRSALNFTLKAAAAITIPSLTMWAFSRDQSWYKAAPQYQKDNGLLFHVGPENTGTTYFFKYPPLASMVYGGLPVRLMERFIADHPEALDGIKASLLEAAMPPVGTQAFGPMQPVVEQIANHSFFRGRPLVPDDVRKTTLPPEQYTKYSTETAKAISQYTNDLPLLRDMQLSPPVVDNYIEQWSGSLGPMAVHFAESTLQAAGVIRPKAASQNVSDLPGFSSFITRYPSASAAPIEEFMERTEKFEQVHGSLRKTMEAGDLERFQQIVNTSPTAAVMHGMKLRGTAGGVTQLNAEHPEQFGDALQHAQQGADQRSMETILKVQKMLKLQRDYVKLVDAMPASQMNAADKRHTEDMIYGWMQTAAEAGVAAMNKAKMP